MLFESHCPSIRCLGDSKTPSLGGGATYGFCIVWALERSLGTKFLVNSGCSSRLGFRNNVSHCNTVHISSLLRNLRVFALWLIKVPSSAHFTWEAGA